MEMKSEKRPGWFGSTKKFRDRDRRGNYILNDVYRFIPAIPLDM